MPKYKLNPEERAAEKERKENLRNIMRGLDIKSFDELREAIEKYIKYYNEKRIKEKLGWVSPVQYRLNTLAA